MMNKAINTLVLATVDSITKFKNKLAYYLAIFAMVFGSTFGTMNAANAAAAPLAGGATSLLAQINDAEDTVVVTFAVGDGNNVATIDAANSAGIVFDTLTNAGIAGTLNIAGEAGSDVTITGAITAIDALTFNITLTEAADLTSSGAHIEVGTGVMIFNITDGETFTRSGDEASAAVIRGAGNLAITGSSTYTDAIGSTTAVANLTTTAAKTVSFGSTVAATAADLDGTVSITGASAIATLAIGSDATTVGSATFTTTLASTTSATINAVATGTFNGIVTTLSLVVNGTANVNVINQATNVVTLGAAGVIQLPKTMTATAAADSVFSNTDQEAGTLTSTGKIYLPSRLNGGDTINLFDDSTTTDTAAALVTATDLVLQNNALSEHTSSIYSADGKLAATGIKVTATDKSDTVTASELGVDKNAARALLQARDAAIAADVATTDTAALTSIYNALYALDGQSATADTDVANQVAPQTDTISGSSLATRAMTGTVQGIVSNRMASLRSGDAFVTGMSAGNGLSANSGFIQAFGSEAEQKNTGPATAKVYGYDSQTSGLAIGFDGMTDNGSIVGLSASYSSTDVDGKGTGKSKNAIDSYTVSVYADKATENGYIEGSLTYGINDNTSSRLVNTAGLSRTYKGDYDSEQISLKVGGGVPNEVIDGTFVTPFASATGTIISTDSYTETSTTANDALRLKIAQDDINSLVGTVGVKAHMITDKGTPMISLSINNEFGDTTINSTNTYTGGGTAFTTSTDVEELSATLGLGYSFGNDVSSVNIGYEANANEDDYLSHYGTVKIISKF